MRPWNKRKRHDDWNRRRVRDYERERALQALRNAMFILAVVIAMFFVANAKVKGIEWFPEPFSGFVTRKNGCQ